MSRKVFLAFVVFGVTACADDGVGLESIAGTYTLQTIDGEGLPAVLEEIGTTFLLEAIAGSVTLNQDMTCSVSLSVRETEDGIVFPIDEVTDVCTYTFNDGAIAVTDSDAFTVSGSITGSTLTVTPEGRVWIYEK